MIEVHENYEWDRFNIEYSFQDRLIELEISNEIKNKLSAAINSLPPKQKEIIYLKFEEELGYLEISEILKISIESARKLLYRALISLRSIVEPKAFLTFFLVLFKKE
jgi:RNA polymerase sigma factor (sigma-70 family)